MWDPEDEYESFSFVRQSQTFPDVLLREQDNGANILMGIELKGWYLLAKEEEPTFRFTVTEAACNPWICWWWFPWTLSNILSGAPRLHRPFIQMARYCARKRNYYWLNERSVRSDAGRIDEPSDVRPYPSKGDNISDRATPTGRRWMADPTSGGWLDTA